MSKSQINVQPMSNWVLVEYTEEQTTEKGDIVLSEVAKRNQYKGRVIAVGPGRYSPITGELIPTTVKEGDIVYFNPFVPDEVKVEGVKCLILREDDIQLRPKK